MALEGHTELQKKPWWVTRDCNCFRGEKNYNLFYVNNTWVGKVNIQLQTYNVKG